MKQSGALIQRLVHCKVEIPSGEIRSRSSLEELKTKLVLGAGDASNIENRTSNAEHRIPNVIVNANCWNATKLKSYKVKSGREKFGPGYDTLASVLRLK